MADKSFGVKELNLLNASGTPTITSPNNLNLNANTVAISTSVTVGQNITVSANAGIASLNVTGIATITRPSTDNSIQRYVITNNSNSDYRFTGPGQDGAENDPDIYLVRGHRYVFTHNATTDHPIQIRVASGGAAYTDGVTYSDTGNNRTTQGNDLIINVQHDAPARLYYQCTSHGGMVGNIYIVGGPQVISGVVTATTFSGSGANLTNLPAANLTGTLPAISGANLTSLPAQATIANNADNRVITGGSGVNLNGESNVVVNGGRLGIGVASPDVELHVQGAGDGMARITSADGSSAFLDLGDVSDKDGGRIQYNTDSSLRFSTASSERLRIKSDGDVIIGGSSDAGYTNYADNLTIHGTSNEGITIRSGNTSGASQGAIYFADATGDVTGAYEGYFIYDHNGDHLRFGTNHQERLRITSSGSLLLGATSYGGGGTSPDFYISSTSGRQVKIHNTNSSTSSLQLTNAATGQGDDNGFQLAALSSGAAYINNAESAQIYFSTNGAIRATMSGTAEQMLVGAQDGFTDYGINNGIFTAYATSSYNASYHVIKGIHANTSFSETGGGMFFLGARRQSTAAYTLAGWYSGNGSSSVASDRQFRFNGDGNAYADASWNGGGADYAEFFEWLDGNTSDENRKGISVVLDNGKIRAATGSDNTDNIIGVISAAPVVVGDSASERWKEKWITDDFGGVIEETYTITEWYDETEKKKVNYSTDLIPSDVTVGAGSSVLSTDENGNAFTRKKLNPSWDSTATYIPRKDRKEWDIVGLMGKLKVKSDQPIGTKWIKMREVSASVHEYLVR